MCLKCVNANAKKNFIYNNVFLNFEILFTTLEFIYFVEQAGAAVWNVSEVYLLSPAIKGILLFICPEFAKSIYSDTNE